VRRFCLCRSGLCRGCFSRPCLQAKLGPPRYGLRSPGCRLPSCLDFRLRLRLRLRCRESSAVRRLCLRLRQQLSSSPGSLGLLLRPFRRGLGCLGCQSCLSCYLLSKARVLNGLFCQFSRRGCFEESSLVLLGKHLATSACLLLRRLGCCSCRRLECSPAHRLLLSQRAHGRRLACCLARCHLSGPPRLFLLLCRLSCLRLLGHLPQQ